MLKLTQVSNLPLAHIINKKNEIIDNVYYHDENNKLKENENENDEEVDDSICEYCNKQFMRVYEKKRHYKSCKQKLLSDFYDSMNTKKVNDIILKKDSIELLGDLEFSHHANPNKRENLLLLGPSGVGKSYYSSNYIKSYHLIKPKSRIYLFSKIENDASFKGQKYVYKVDLDGIEEEKVNMKQELLNSLCVFDDIEDSSNKKLTDYLVGLNNEILHQGRDQSLSGDDIYSITTMHISEGHKTRKSINEATSITVFQPLNYQSTTMLTKYCGLSKNQINKIKNLKSRWITVFTHHPQIILTQKKIYLLSNF